MAGAYGPRSAKSAKKSVEYRLVWRKIFFLILKGLQMKQLEAVERIERALSEMAVLPPLDAAIPADEEPPAIATIFTPSPAEAADTASTNAMPAGSLARADRTAWASFFRMSMRHLRAERILL